MALPILRLIFNIGWCWLFGRSANDSTTGIDKVKIVLGWLNSTAGQRIRCYCKSQVVAAAPPPFPPNDPNESEEV